MEIHTSTVNTDISLSREFQRYISDPTRANGLLDHGKDPKCDSKRKWTEPEYHVQYSKYVPHTSVKILCATTQSPELSFCGPHTKPHVVRGLSKHYHLRLEPQLGHGKYAI